MQVGAAKARFHWASSRLPSLSPGLGNPLDSLIAFSQGMALPAWHYLPSVQTQVGRLPDALTVRWVGAAGPAIWAEVWRAGETSSVTSGNLSLAILSYEWVMCALLGRVLICESYGDKCCDKQDILWPQMPQGTKVNMLHAHLACLTLMEQVGNNWLFKKCCISFPFIQKAHTRWVVITAAFTNLPYSEIGKWGE